jgi:flagellar hook-length control protein FliK
MTVYSIDKRVVPEANMTPADRQQAGTSAADAFAAVLLKASANFGGRPAGAASPDAVLAEHFSRPQVDPRPAPAKAARPEPQASRGQAVKEARAATRPDKPRQAPASSAPRAADKAADPAADQSDDAAATPDKAAKADKAQPDQNDSGQASGNDNGQQAQQVAADPTPATAVTAAESRVASQLVPTVDGQAQAAQPDQAAETAAQSPQANAAKPAPSLPDASRGPQLAADAGDADDVDDGLDFASQAAAQLKANAGRNQAGAPAAAAKAAQPDTVQSQSDDLANLLAGTNANLNVKVKVNESAAAAPVAAAPVAEALAQLDVARDGAASGQATAQATPDLDAQPAVAGQGDVAPQPPVALAAQAAAAQHDEGNAAEVTPFAATLAAQLEANEQVDPAKTDTQPVVGLANVGPTQAADKAGPAQATQAPRTPRTLLQQQVSDQVTVQIDKQVKDGADTIKIALKPVELGSIEIKLEVGADGKVSATVTADKPETLAILQKDAKGLEKALGDAGLKPDANALSFNLRGENQHNADRGGNNPRFGRGRGRNAQGDDGRLATAPLQATGQARGLGGRSSVDISV